MEKQLIVVPAYKPTDILVDFCKELGKYFQQIVVVDDGSGEKYESIFNEVENIDFCTVLRHYTNMGKGRALKTAFNYCLSLGNKAVFGVITVDADGQHCIEDILNVSKIMNETEGLVLGSRSFEDKKIPFRSRFGNKISCKVYNWLCGINISDTQTGLRGLPFRFLEKACCTCGERYEYETNMLLDAKEYGLDFIEVSIKAIYEKGNPTSHFNPLVDSLKIYTVLFKYSISSLISVLVDYAAYIMLIGGGGTNVLQATYIARASSALINFSINRKKVFKSNDNLLRQLIRYIILAVFSATISGILVLYISSLLRISSIYIKIVIETILYFWNYYIQRIFVFASTNKNKGE